MTMSSFRTLSNYMRRLYFIGIMLGLLCLIFISGCQTGSSPTQTATPARSLPKNEPTLARPTPTVSVTPTPTPSPSQTVTPTATLTPPNPLTIDWLRQQDYPGSDIVIEETLEPGANYDRYLASYLSEGLKIYALLTVPRGEPPPTGWPAIIFNHGYIPPNQYRTTERYVAYVDALARQGYVVFRPDYRGHGESEGIASGAYGSPDYVVDVLNALASVQRYPGVDPQRIGMWGHSMGGYITLRAMVVSPDIKAGVIWAGVVAAYPDLLERWRRSSPLGDSSTPRPGGWRSLLQRLFGTPQENPDFWASISANNYLADLSGPIQLHHGTADESVPVEFSQDLYQQLTKAGQTTEFYRYEGDNHNLSNSFSEAMLRTIYFYNQFVKGEG